MKTIFADTFYWVALANPRDQWHEKAKTISGKLRPARLATTDEVLVKFLTQLGSVGPALRRKASRLVREVLTDPNVDVIPQSHASFVAGLEFYESRPDKRYSLTDCVSMNTMRSEGLTEALTHDVHFIQEGFRALFRE